eukprot:comp24297_c0_seq1/m.45554 comp24297_c0_seq1/g.45554  ORF comp24297_c0_seq1/g.45554 comp24297_c0_seq1/m.45554 type:complete len:453 (+) comp24297_c0_seq1:672-2030(+)
MLLLQPHVPVQVLLGVGGHHDAGGAGGGAAGQALPQLLGDKGHDGVQQPQAHVQARVQHLLRSGLGPLVAAGKHGLDRLQVDVAEVVEPEVVDGLGDGRERVTGHVLVDPRHGRRQPRQDPPVQQRVARPGPLLGRRGLEAGGQAHEGKAGGVPQLVAEVAVAHDAVDVQVCVLAGHGVGHQGKAQRIRAALGDACRVVVLLAPLGLLDLPGVQVALQQLGVQAVQADAVDHVHGVHHVAQGLAHLAPVRIADQRMQVHLREGQVAHEAQAHHDHSCHPEEQDVVPRLQQLPRIEPLEVVSLLGPAKDAEGEQARREPRVQHVGVLVQPYAPGIDPKLGCCLCHGLLLCGGHNPVGLVVLVQGLAPLNLHKVGRDAVAPPQLPGDAPGLDVLQPAVPGLLVQAGDQFEAAVPHGLHGFSSGLGAVQEPLGLDHGLDNVLGAAAHGQHHGVAD